LGDHERMTPDRALDAVIRNARYLFLAFDGPIRSVDKVEPADSAAAAPVSAYLSETLAACRESGRSAAVISSSSPAEARRYLDAHDLLNRVAVVAASIGEAASTLETSAVDCVIITSSPADIEAARAAGTPSIGYARTPDDAARLVDAGAATFVYSMADVALRIRAHPLPN
jgi:phosphoglycolate phosphatase